MTHFELLEAMVDHRILEIHYRDCCDTRVNPAFRLDADSFAPTMNICGGDIFSSGCLDKFL